MAKPNYRQARRAVDEAKKKKQEEKRKRKLERKNNPDADGSDLNAAEAPDPAGNAPSETAQDA